MARLYLFRHGDTDWPIVNQRRLIGAANDLEPLTPRGIEEIEITAAQLHQLGITLVVSSPMTRALQSAALVSRALDVPLQVAFDLHEWVPDRTYRWRGPARVLRLYAEMLAANGERPANRAEPVWESMSSLRARAQRALAPYLAHHGPVAVATNSVVIRALTGANAQTGEIVECDPAPDDTVT